MSLSGGKRVILGDKFGGDTDFDADGTVVKVGGLTNSDEEMATPASPTLREGLALDPRGILLVSKRGRQARGRYRQSIFVGPMNAGLAADAEVLQMRWAASGANAGWLNIHRLTLHSFYATTGFTAGVGIFKAWQATDWTADGSGGSTASVTPSPLRRATHSPSNLAIRYATSVALGAGAKASTNPFAEWRKLLPNTAIDHFNGDYDLFNQVNHEDEPMRLAPVTGVNQSGIFITANMPATGVWGALFSICFSETASPE